MSRSGTFLRTSRFALAVLLGFISTHEVARADGSPAAAPITDAFLTHFESFVLYNCTPCVRELYSIATVPIPSIKGPSFSGLAPPNPAAIATRAGEMRFELLRAYAVGQESRQHLAMRVVLSVSAGTEGALYPVGAGLLDEDEVPALAAALAHMSQSMPPGAEDSSLRLVDTEFHADSVRMGTVRTGGDVFAYVQVAPTDLPRFALKHVWELPTMYFASKDIPTLERGVSQVNAKLRAVRGR